MIKLDENGVSVGISVGLSCDGLAEGPKHETETPNTPSIATVPARLAQAAAMLVAIGEGVCARRLGFPKLMNVSD